jgi:hypothetical protein
MSFTWNPYRHMDVVVDQDGTVSLRCDGCGAELVNPNLSLSVPIRVARDLMNEHIQRGHQRTRADFEGWE